MEEPRPGEEGGGEECGGGEGGKLALRMLAAYVLMLTVE